MPPFSSLGWIILLTDLSETCYFILCLSHRKKQNSTEIWLAHQFVRFSPFAKGAGGIAAASISFNSKNPPGPFAKGGEFTRFFYSEMPILTA
jgi:hypothetical protein